MGPEVYLMLDTGLIILYYKAIKHTHKKEKKKKQKKKKKKKKKTYKTAIIEVN